MPETSPRPRRGLSFEYRLPLLITALLLATTAVGGYFAYQEVRQASVLTAAERLRLVSQQLSSLVAPSVPQRLAALRDSALQPALAAALTDPSPANRAAAEAVLRRVHSPSDPDLPVVLWAPDHRTVAQTGPLPRGAEGRALPDSTGIGRFFGGGSRTYFWLAVPVRGAGGTLGYLAEMRRLGGANTGRQIEALIGPGFSVFFANRAGREWVTLDGGVVAAPARWPFEGAARYQGRGGESWMAHATPVPGTPWAMVAALPHAAVLERPRAFLRNSRVAGLLLGVLGALLAWILTRGITRSVRALRQAADAIARGDYGRRIDLDRSDELGALASSFNLMAARVQTSHAELSAQFRTAQSLAAELEAANERLAIAAREADDARREAEEANRAKSDFLATMSHEIRTPINAIIGYTDLLQLGVAGPITEGQQAQLERVRVSGRHLMGLVDQVLDLSRIETNTLAVDTLTATVADAVRMATTVLRPEADHRGVRILADCADELRYEGDPQHVGQVLVNLLSNAIKFSPAGGEVRLGCETRLGHLPRGGAWGRWVCALVHDQGPGVPEDQAARIFEPFVQAETGYTRRHGGAGLGLAISLRLAHSMGGDLTLESRPGEGATFVLWLPTPRD